MGIAVTRISQKFCNTTGENKQAFSFRHIFWCKFSSSHFMFTEILVGGYSKHCVCVDVCVHMGKLFFHPRWKDQSCDGIKTLPAVIHGFSW